MSETGQPDRVPSLVWEVESTHPEISEKLKTGLREVVDPEIGLDIVALGLVRNVQIEEDQAKVTMILTTPFCPYGPAMLDTTRKKAEEVLQMPVTLEMGMEMWDFSMMEEGAGSDWGMW